MVGIPLSEEEIHELLIEEKTCWLATVSPNGEPHLIPIHFGFFDDNVHLIFVSRASKSVRNIENNLSVCFGLNVGEREGQIRCVLINGKAKVTNDIDLLKRAHRKFWQNTCRPRKRAKNFFKS